MATEQPSPEDAAAALRTLDADRRALATQAAPPRALMAAFGAIAAWWVGAAQTTSPGAGYQPAAAGWLPVAAAIVVAYLVRERTGVRFRSSGPRAAGAFVAILVSCLGLYSASLALVSLGATWAVALTSAAAFLLVWWLATVAHRAALDHVARG
jgi:FtsH-binding integral membrane protein